MGEERGRENKNVKYRTCPTPSIQSLARTPCTEPLIEDWTITSAQW